MQTQAAAKNVSPRTSAGFEYTFPAIRGIQAGREFYVSMCPLRLIPRIFHLDEDELTPEMRAQRVLNKGRLPALTKYILDNPDDYVFSALTASVDGHVTCEGIHRGPAACARSSNPPWMPGFRQTRARADIEAGRLIGRIRDLGTRQRGGLLP
ncbi:DNA sulfur modification protein DndB [Streptomyces sp. DHE17-7]|uniref:DNA sulfur modification protein DndB n=1 Tax=Streptomyces sp. DHE17-7 TaxID=2759949 RepID=UPI0022EA5279|nr:DNA sulfur modification protein DndB [Streptomyces sp. DHE17-7]